MFSLAQAAEAAGRNRSTILRAIKSGHLTATRDAFGKYEIAESELHRVYPPGSAQQGNGNKTSESATAFAALEQAIAVLREQLAAANKNAEDWKAMAMRALPAPTPSWWPWRRAG
jgi:hypothetical protein